jgi:hypothetical protein
MYVHFQKEYKIIYFHFLQCALSDSINFAFKIVFYLLKKFTIFSYFKGTYQRKRCTFKNNIKSHISIFYSAPCQISLCLHQSLCFTYLHSLQFFSLSKVPTKEKRALSKMILNPICSRFTVRPVSFLYIYIKFSVLPTNTVYNFFLRVSIKEKCTLSK